MLNFNYPLVYLNLRPIFRLVDEATLRLTSLPSLVGVAINLNIICPIDRRCMKEFEVWR